jgi:hypothetical protein
MGGVEGAHAYLLPVMRVVSDVEEWARREGCSEPMDELLGSQKIDQPF